MQDYLFNNQAKAFLKKWVLRLLFKLSTDFHSRISLGRAFHNLGPATEKNSITIIFQLNVRFTNIWKQLIGYLRALLGLMESLLDR